MSNKTFVIQPLGRPYCFYFATIWCLFNHFLELIESLDGLMKKSDVDGGLRETNKFFKGREFKVSTAYKPPPHIFCDKSVKR